VGPRLARAALPCAVLWALGSPAAAADWQVRRASPAPLLDAAVVALWQHPDDGALARRVVQLAGRRGAAALRQRLRAHAEAAADYAGYEAYARVLTALGDAPAAAVAYEQALQRRPESPAALEGHARALAAAGDASASAAYDQALAHEQRPPARRNLLEGAIALLPAEPRGADLERAIALRREIDRLAPDDAGAALALSELLEQAGRPEEAAAVLEAKGRSAANLALAVRAARLRGGSPDAASAARGAAALAELLHQVPASDRRRRREIWSAARDVARARGTLSQLSDALAKNPGPVEWNLLGEVREELGDLDGALEATRRAQALEPRDAALGRRLVALLDRAGRPKEARQVAEELARALPGDPALAAEAADGQWQAGDHAQAGATLDRALSRFARQPTALEQLAELAGRWRDDRRAIRAWTQLTRLDPDSEIAIVGLGEAQFQAGDRAAARRTWAALRRRAGAPAAGHLRLGEILLDHDLTNDARDEARAAQASDAEGAAPHRLLARIAERQHQNDLAIAEWEKVLAASAGPAGRADAVAARQEARSRVLALLAREGRGKLEARIRELRQRVNAHPDDVESALFLAEAEQRMGDLDGATATLRALADRGTAATKDDVAIEAGFALVRLLKRQGRLSEAESRLDDLARVAPSRAREAELQGAEIALARHDGSRALTHATAAATGADPAALVRVGEIREQAGDDSGAADAYRAALGAGDAPPTAALALARLLERRGDASGAAATLEALLHASRDDASVGDAARRAAGVDELLGRLPALAESLARPDPEGTSAPARRRALLDVLARLPMPPPDDEAARDAWIRVGRLALRPLLDIVAADGEAPDRRALDLLGELGDGDAAPALARIAARALDSGAGRDPRRPGFAAREAGMTALAALARLGDPRGFDVLARAADDPSPSLRRIGLWGLARTPDPRGTGRLLRALDDPQIDLQALGCLGLGRVADGRATATLARVAQDPARAPLVRRAAVAALGRTGAAGVEPLLALLDGGDGELAPPAAAALGLTGDPRVPPALIARALLPGRRGAADPQLAIRGLAVWNARRADRNDWFWTSLSSGSGGPPPIADLLAASAVPASSPDLFALWRVRVPAVIHLLGEAIGAGGESRRTALLVLDSRRDEPGLGALAPAGSDPISPEAAQAVREIAATLADAVADALDDPDRGIRAAALSVLAKLGDPRITSARIAAAVADGDPDLADGAVRAARQIVRAAPGAAAPLIAAVAPLARDDGRTPAWRTRLAAVRVLAELGPAGLDAVRAAAARDRNAVVRAAAQAVTGMGGDTPG
jgi:tetratricopeptide (TPR) repeat protein